MTQGTITGTVTTPVLLGVGHYGRSLKIAQGGEVAPAAYGVPAAISAASQLGFAAVSNAGIILGATGLIGQKGHGGNGGVGINLHCIGDIANAGTITGGSGRDGKITDGGNALALWAGGTLTNDGSIIGGTAGFSGVENMSFGLGGAGVFAAAPATIVNDGTIKPGYGDELLPATAAIDFLSSGNLINQGIIGQDIASLGSVRFGGAANVHNAGTIYGLRLNAGGIVENTGNIEGQAGAFLHFSATAGGTGLFVTGSATVVNSGTITGGQGAFVSFGASTAGGIGIDLAGTQETLFNTGSIQGGVLPGEEVLPPGGAGIIVGSGDLLVNHGSIAGGYGSPGTVLDGGVAVDVRGGVAVNAGSLTGGSAPKYSHGQSGGTGVLIQGGTLVAHAGTIAGGLGTSESGQQAGPADAVAFGAATPGTLVVDPGAVFLGGIEASSTAQDVLVLAGPGQGTLSGFGIAGGIENFSAIEENAGAHWILTGRFTDRDSITMGAHAVLALNVTTQATPVSFSASGGDTLRLNTVASFNGVLYQFGAGDAIDLANVDATSFRYASGVLTLLGASGTTVASLNIDGAYSDTDFALKSIAGGTQVDWAGSSSQPGWHFPWGLSI